MNPFARRRESLMSGLPREELDAYLISSPVNVSYLTGFSGESSHLILTQDRALLVSDPRFTEQIAEECPGLESHIRPPTKSTLAAVAEVIGQLALCRIGFESTALSVADFEALKELLPAAQWKGAGNRVERLRMVKDPSEIQEIREAIDIAERAFTVFCALLRRDDSEVVLCDAMESYVRRAGGRGTCFPSIIAVGARAALPHAPPTGRIVGEEELLLVDWGVSGRFYKSDLTRVLDTRRSGILPPGARRRLEEVHAVVLRAQERAIRAVRPGVKAEDVDTAARAEIADAGFGDYFGHGLGHGIGLQVHEAPALRPRSQTVLEPGMVFTIEPGIYLPGWGGVRIEDDVLVTPDGYEMMTSVNRELTTIF